MAVRDSGRRALAATLVGLWLYNRREARRKHAIELMKLMNRWGLDWFADLYEDYAVGDYSGLAVKVREIVTAVRSDEAMVAKLGEVAKKVAALLRRQRSDQGARADRHLAKRATEPGAGAVRRG